MENVGFLLILLLVLGWFYLLIRSNGNRSKQLKEAENIETTREKITIAQSLGEQGVTELLAMSYKLFVLTLSTKSSQRETIKEGLIETLDALNNWSNTVGSHSDELQVQVANFWRKLVLPSVYDSEAEFQLNLRAGELMADFANKWGLKVNERTYTLFSPPSGDNSKKYPQNLKYVASADVLVKGKEQAGAAISAMLKGISAEEARWPWKSSGWGMTGLAAGLLLGGAGTLLTTLIVSATQSAMASNASKQAQQVGAFKSALMISSEEIDLKAFESMSDQARFMTALRIYATGLTKLAAQYPDVVKDQFEKNRTPMKQAALEFALALNGDPSAYEPLRTLSTAADWPTRILAFEGLIALANTDETANVVTIGEQTRALEDKDLQVYASIVNVMAATQNPVYVTHLMEFAKSPDSNKRGAALSALFVLARNGNNDAYAKLKFMSEEDSDKNIRESAKKQLTSIEQQTNQI